MSNIAFHGGTPGIVDVPDELFRWPIITAEDEKAAREVFLANRMSATDITEKFEEEFASWLGAKYGVAYCNGTLALQAAMFGCGLSRGDEIICPSKTYWASCLQAFNLGATVVFADIDKNTLCISPDDIERCISPKTKAIMVVHYCAHPADMDRIMEIADRHGIAVIEDVSHAQGGKYKGKRLGTFGRVGAMSLMSGKSFACGEMGILVTDDKEVRDRALAFSHYERNKPSYISTEYLLPYCGLPLGGMKGRVNQVCSAMGRVQLKYYDERCAEIRRAMNYFWDKAEGLPGITPVRVDESDGSDMAGWYFPQGIYHPEELGGLSVTTFCKALKAEGFPSNPGANLPLHTHPFFKTYSVREDKTPLRIEFSSRDVRTLDSCLFNTEDTDIFSVPWFKKLMPEHIDKYVEVLRKVCGSYEELLCDDIKDSAPTGQWYTYSGKKEKHS